MVFAYIVGTAFVVKKARASVSGLGSVVYYSQNCVGARRRLAGDTLLLIYLIITYLLAAARGGGRHG